MMDEAGQAAVQDGGVFRALGGIWGYGCLSFTRPSGKNASLSNLPVNLVKLPDVLFSSTDNAHV